ncbi:hypothetical protein Q2T94_01455 [Paeniglutamicibacter sulfureus]|uniref:hypothetical protein n=1 Tax=Paeniglutamicibacter sulfureus TaxID=43666 RepID=UPI00266605A9|nr:hypothetical protein [Paeniglutamicibacter sulfureus]MDO2932972.1 hypothetical protein [Paeniglutamicibacter sulfureus]
MSGNDRLEVTARGAHAAQDPSGSRCNAFRVRAEVTATGLGDTQYLQRSVQGEKQDKLLENTAHFKRKIALTSDIPLFTVATPFTPRDNNVKDVTGYRTFHKALWDKT